MALTDWLIARLRQIARFVLDRTDDRGMPNASSIDAQIAAWHALVGASESTASDVRADAERAFGRRESGSSADLMVPPLRRRSWRARSAQTAGSSLVEVAGDAEAAGGAVEPPSVGIGRRVASRTSRLIRPARPLDRMCTSVVRVASWTRRIERPFAAAIVEPDIGHRHLAPTDRIGSSFPSLESPERLDGAGRTPATALRAPSGGSDLPDANAAGGRTASGIRRIRVRRTSVEMPVEMPVDDVDVAQRSAPGSVAPITPAASSVASPVASVADGRREIRDVDVGAITVRRPARVLVAPAAETLAHPEVGREQEGTWPALPPSTLGPRPVPDAITVLSQATSTSPFTDRIRLERRVV